VRVRRRRPGRAGYDHTAAAEPGSYRPSSRSYLRSRLPDAADNFGEQKESSASPPTRLQTIDPPAWWRLVPAEREPRQECGRAGDMTKRRIHSLHPHLSSRSLWLAMIEMKYPQPPVARDALAVLDRHIGTAEVAREITPTRRLGSRPVRVSSGLFGELQLLQKDCPLGDTPVVLYIAYDPGSM